MPKRGENIYQRRDSRWEGRYIKGRDPLTNQAQYGYVYAATYNQCKHLKALAEAEGRESAKKNRTATVAPELDQWLAEKRADPAIHAGTLQVYEYHIEKHLKPALGSARLSLLSGETLHSFRLRQLRAGRLDGKGGLSASTVNTQMVILFGMLDLARRQKHITSLPELPGRRQAVSKEKPETRVLNRAEQSCLEGRLLRELSDRDLTYRGVCLGVFLALYTGLRVGELGGLQWRDVSFTEATLTVRRTLSRVKAEEGEAKTEVCLGAPKSRQSGRVIPLNRTLLQMLREHHEGGCGGRRRGEEYVFAYRGGPIEPRLFQKRFKRLLEESSVAEGNFHCLRHTFATRCLERGMDLQSLSEILGHSTATVTAKVYAHALHHHKAECMERLTLLAPTPETGEWTIRRQTV